MMNPSAEIQICQYAQSVSDLFKLMIQEKQEEFENRVKLVRIIIIADNETKTVHVLIDY